MLSSDCTGRASFAILAISILLFANLSITFFYNIQKEGNNLIVQINEFHVIRNLSEVVGKQVEVAAFYLAMDAIKNATQGSHNLSRINRIFSESYNNFIVSTFPYKKRGYQISIDEYNITVLTSVKNMEDFVKNVTIVENDKFFDYSKAIKTDDPGDIETIQRVVYFSLIGYLNYTISKAEIFYRIQKIIESDLESPYPFINQQVKRFSNLAQGSLSDMEQILKYILTTVTQNRVFLGYAGGEYGKLGTFTHDILTVHDVEMAINLALILTQIKHFRSYDIDSVIQFDMVYFYESDNMNDTENQDALNEKRTLKRLLNSYAIEGTIDPADLYILFNFIDKNNIHINILLAQALYAIIDQFVLKYLDYVDFFPIEFVADFGLNILENLANAVQDFINWFMGNDKEAELVKAYVNDLFDEMGVNSNIGGPVTIFLPEQNYSVTNEDGKIYDISIIANSHNITYNYIPLIQNHNDIWKAYFSTIFQNDLKQVHKGVRDLARDVARKIAYGIEQIGVFEPISFEGRISPSDRIGFLDEIQRQLFLSIDNALNDIKDNSNLFIILVQNLWNKTKVMISGLLDYIKSNYSTFLSQSQYITSAQTKIIASLINTASKDPDYSSLDQSGKDNLRNQIQLTVIAMRWANTTYDQVKNIDFSRFDALYHKAISMNTPPGQGGLYRRLLETVTGTAGIFALAGNTIKVFLEGMINNEEITNAKVFIPISTSPYRFYEDELVNEGRKFKEEKLVVDQIPNLLTITRFAEHLGSFNGSPSTGELWIELIDPASIPLSRNSPNVHYTRIDEISNRPYETQWTIRIKASIEIKVSSARGIFLDLDGHAPTDDRAFVPLDLQVAIKIFSGWPLENVEYLNSNVFTNDIWNLIQDFLDNIWDAVTSILDWILDGAKLLIDQLVNLFDYVLSQAAKYLKVIYETFSWVIDLFQEVLKNAISWLLEALDFIIKFLPPFEFSLSAFGFTFNICVNGASGNRLILSLTSDSFALTVRFVNIKEAGQEPLNGFSNWNIFSNWHMKLGALEVDVALDPLMMIDNRFLIINASWDRSWKIRIVMPEIEAYYDFSVGINTPPIQTPIGDIEFGLGFQARLTEEFNHLDVIELISRCIQDIQDKLRNIELEWESIKNFLMRFIRKIIDYLLHAIQRIIDNVIDISIEFKALFRWGDVAGTGIRISLLLDGEGAVMIFTWIANNIRNLLDRLFNPSSSFHFEMISKTILSHFYLLVDLILSVGLPGFILETHPIDILPEYQLAIGFGTSISFFGGLLGLDWGSWDVYFGARIESIPPLIANGLFNTGLKTVDFWLIKGFLMPA